jgi:DNA-binding transcriptional LysR family regulator
MFEIREIEAFLAVAAELHFGRAAERLHVSTASVSQAVRALERRVGAPVFERTSRRVQLTPLGDQLLRHLRPAYQRLEQIFNETQRTATAQGAPLTVGFATSLPAETMPALVDAFKASGHRIVAVPVNPMDMFLWDNRIGVGLDAAVGWLPPGTRRRVSAELAAGPVVRRGQPALLMAADHPLAHRAAVDIEELAGVEFLAANDLDQLIVPWVPSTTPSGRPITRVRREVRYLENLMAELADSRLVHLTIWDFGLTLPLDGLALVPLTGREPFLCRVVWPSSRETPSIRHFAETAAHIGAEAGWLRATVAGG